MNSLEAILPSPTVLYLANVALAALLACAAALSAAFLFHRRSAPVRNGLLLVGLVLTLTSPALVWLAGRTGIGRLQIGSRETIWVDPAELSNTRIEAPVSSSADFVVPSESAADLRAPASSAPFPWWSLGQGLAWAWAAGTAVSLVRLLYGLVRLATFCRGLDPVGWDSVPTRSGRSPNLHGLRQAATQAAAQVGLACPPRLFLSAQTLTPVTFGLFRPAVGLPEGLADDLPPDQLRAVLLHELAHVARRDPWLGLTQRLAAAFYWWCPLVHRLNRRLAEVREELCDNYVLRHQGDGASLAEALVTLAERVVTPSRLPATVSMFEHRLSGERSQALQRRVRRLLSTETNPMTHMNRLSLLLVALAGLGMTGVISLCQVRGASEEAPGAKGGATKPAASPANEPLAGPDKLLADARAKLNSSPGAKNIVAALLQDTKFEFIETPFSEFVAKISERHGIPIRIDEQKWLADLGIERIDLPVTRKLNGLSLHSSLQLVLSDLASTYVIRDDTLMITSVQESRRLAQQGAIHADDVKRELERSPTFRRKKAKIVGDLEDLTQMDFQAMPLGKAIDSIRNRRGTAIEIDVRELDDVGIRDDVPCTLSVKGVKLAAALDKLLGELGLTYVVEGEYILVTARKKASPAKDNGKAAAPADPASAPGSRGAAASANLETGKPAPLWF